MVDITQACGICKGAGEIKINPVGGGGTRPCPHCGASGSISAGEIDLSRLTTKLNRILRILEGGEKATTKKKG